jgi:hypothetical protein
MEMDMGWKEDWIIGRLDIGEIGYWGDWILGRLERVEQGAHSIS